MKLKLITYALCSVLSVSAYAATQSSGTLMQNSVSLGKPSAGEVKSLDTKNKLSNGSRHS